jgi:hypothetical protein
VNKVVVQAWAGDRPRIIDICLNTVRGWAALQGFDYRFETDALLTDVPESYRRQVSGLIMPMTNFGRLLLLLDESFSPAATGWSGAMPTSWSSTRQTCT